MLEVMLFQQLFLFSFIRKIWGLNMFQKPMKEESEKLEESKESESSNDNESAGEDSERLSESGDPMKKVNIPFLKHRL